MTNCCVILFSIFCQYFICIFIFGFKKVTLFFYIYLCLELLYCIKIGIIYAKKGGNMVYKIALIVGIILGISGCQWESITKENYSYQIQGIETYKGQEVAELLNINGAPNAIKKFNNGEVLWIYYTNYRPVGGGELISFNEPTQQQIGTSCVVKIIIFKGIVQQVISNCE